MGGDTVVWFDPRSNFSATPLAACAAGVSPSSLVVAPFVDGGGGVPAAAAIIACGDNVLLVLPGATPGMFDSPRVLAAPGIAPKAAAFVSVARSASLPLVDLVVAGAGLVWYRQSSPGVFNRTARSVAVGPSDIQGMVAWDMNKDGVPDIAVASVQDNRLAIVRGCTGCASGFNSSAELGLLVPGPSTGDRLCEPCLVDQFDVDADGVPDLVAYCCGANYRYGNRALWYRGLPAEPWMSRASADLFSCSPCVLQGGRLAAFNAPNLLAPLLAWAPGWVIGSVQTWYAQNLDYSGDVQISGIAPLSAEGVLVAASGGAGNGACMVVCVAPCACMSVN